MEELSPHDWQGRADLSVRQRSEMVRMQQIAAMERMKVASAQAKMQGTGHLAHEAGQTLEKLDEGLAQIAARSPHLAASLASFERAFVASAHQAIYDYGQPWI
jgi:hypothetical protein